MDRQLLRWDNWLGRPYRPSPDDVVVRVEADDFAIDLETHTVSTAAGDSVTLTPMQWRLVEFFVRNPGRPLTSTQLLHAGWGFRDDADAGTVGILVDEVRARLEPDPTRPRYFVTEPGTGYRFVPADPAQDGPIVGEVQVRDPVERLIDAFSTAIHPTQIEQQADLLRLLGDERAVPALLERLCESRVNNDPDVEDAVCGALVAFGIMERLGNRRFCLRRDDQLTPGARQALTERRAFVPRRYWSA